MTATLVVTGWSWVWLILGVFAGQRAWDGIEWLRKKRRRDA